VVACYSRPRKQSHGSLTRLKMVAYGCHHSHIHASRWARKEQLLKEGKRLYSGHPRVESDHESPHSATSTCQTNCIGSIRKQIVSNEDKRVSQLNKWESVSEILWKSPHVRGNARCWMSGSVSPKMIVYGSPSLVSTKGKRYTVSTLGFQ
jgi:hypothetical protein